MGFLRSFVIAHVFEKVAQEKHAHAQHEGDATDAHETVIGGEQINQSVHRVLLK
jgi:hypothetical protein